MIYNRNYRKMNGYHQKKKKNSDYKNKKRYV